MREKVKIVIALTIIGAVAPTSPAGATPRLHHLAKHHRSRHLHGHHRIPGAVHGQPLILLRGEPAGYRYGGPLYSTCDRINADRMLVGTCR